MMPTWMKSGIINLEYHQQLEYRYPTCKNLKMIRLSVITLVTAVLTACVSPSGHLPQLTFKHLPPITLQVSDIHITSLVRNGTQAPNVGHRFPVSPEQGLKKWARDRLQIGGTRRTARFTILQADAKETKLRIDKKLTGLFKQQASEQYNTAVKARLEIIDDRGIQLAQVTARATWQQNIREDASLLDRRRIWFELVEKLIGRFNSEMDRSIQRFMPAYVL